MMSLTSLRNRFACCCLIAIGWSSAAADQPIILDPADFAHHVERFNAMEDEPVVNLIPNAQSWEWIVANAPLFDCPDKEFEEIFYYRWWTYRKHIKRTPHGRVLTEFITPVGHAGPYNTISCAFGHHLAEGRWLRDQQLLDEYTRFWFRTGPGGGRAEHFHKFSSWAATAIYDRYLVTGDREFVVGLLDDLVADYEAWEAERRRADGLFWQYDVRDGMEESISGSRTAKNVRPTINSYMYGNARAIACASFLAGRDDLGKKYMAKYSSLREKVIAVLWDADAKFFKVRFEDNGLSDAREAIGFVPWMFNLAGPEHAEAWRQIRDPAGFLAPRGLTTAERRHPQFRSHGIGTCEWDGAVWPFATSQTLDGLINVLRGPKQPYVSRRDFLEQMLTYARSHQRNGQPYIGEYLDETTGAWLITGPKAQRSRYYNHSTFCDLVIRGLVGIVPRADDTVEVDPLLPEDAWDWFCLDGVPYHGHSLTVIWDRDGSRYGRGAGLAIRADGREIARSATLSRLTATLPQRAGSREQGASTTTSRSKRCELWYNAPAAAWTEALPVGNGGIGAMVFGGVARARYQFNEDSLWTGGPHSYAHPGAAQHLPQLRQLLLDDKQREAERLAMRHFMSVPLRQMAYQPFGDVELEFAHNGTPIAVVRGSPDPAPNDRPAGGLVARSGDRPQQRVTDYRRSLDLDTAIAKTVYQIGGVSYTRETFASYPDRAIVIHLTSDQPGRLEFTARVSSPQADVSVKPADDRTLAMTGRVRDYSVRGGGVVRGETTFASHLRVIDMDGDVEANDDALTVRGASRATLVLTAATSVVNFRDVSADPVERSRTDVERAAKKSFNALRADHVRDHQALFRRVSLRLGPSDDRGSQELPTEERVLRSKRVVDPALAELLFQYGRYLLIASSRPGGQPANLQGLWNDQLDPPWESKYTTNINAEMNYWPIEPCNLSECGQPLFDAIGELAESGRETAQAHYAARGWVLHHNFDLWRGTAPINASDHGIWPTGGAWLCQHLWWHYSYSGDEQFLRDTAYPIMKSAALFFADYLFEDPRNDKFVRGSQVVRGSPDPAQKGAPPVGQVARSGDRPQQPDNRPQRWLISGPSNSPEQGGLVLGPTMDHQIIRNLFANTIHAAEVLGVDEKFRGELARLRERIAPNQIGRHGQLQEWLEDKDDPNNRHRHVSHMWGLFPGDEITPDTPELFNAARRSLEMRGDGGTGWSLAWKINLWARLGDGDHAHRMLGNLLTLTGSPKTRHRGGGVYPNLFDAHPPFQIDGNFGAASGICQMLIQSHRHADDGTRLVELLPALPSAWPEGEVTGLRARDGFDVDIRWSGGGLRECTIHSRLGQPVTIAYGDQRRRLDFAKGDTVRLGGDLDEGAVD